MCERHRERCVCEREGERGREVSVGGVGVCKKCTVSVWCVCEREREREVWVVCLCVREREGRGGEGTQGTQREGRRVHILLSFVFFTACEQVRFSAV